MLTANSHKLFLQRNRLSRGFPERRARQGIGGPESARKSRIQLRQRLKPQGIYVPYGTAEAVPYKDSECFTKIPRDMAEAALRRIYFVSCDTIGRTCCATCIAQTGPPMKVRWRICFLLFLTWLMSYIDRSLMPMAIPLIGQEFHLSPTVMGVVLSAFFIGYASMQIPGGMIADKFGARKTITLGVASWSLFSLLTGTIGSLASLIGVRILFGLGEGMHPPAAFKALSAWFNSAERARANGLVMSSNTIGPMIAPILFATVMGAFGWRKAFYLVSIPGFLITLAVYWYLRDTPAEHPHMTAGELAEIGAESESQEKLSFPSYSNTRRCGSCFLFTWRGT